MFSTQIYTYYLTTFFGELPDTLYISLWKLNKFVSQFRFLPNVGNTFCQPSNNSESEIWQVEYIFCVNVVLFTYIYLHLHLLYPIFCARRSFASFYYITVSLRLYQCVSNHRQLDWLLNNFMLTTHKLSRPFQYKDRLSRYRDAPLYRYDGYETAASL